MAFMVIVIIFVVLVLVNQNILRSIFAEKTSLQTLQSEIVVQIKDEFIKCYGSVFSDVSKECVEYGTAKALKAYQIQSEKYGNCNEASLKDTTNPSVRYTQRYTYYVPVQQGDRICPGKLVLYLS